MNHLKFAELLKKYQAGQASASEQKIIAQWFSLLDHDPRVLSADEWDALEKRLWSKLEARTQDQSPPPGKNIPFFQHRSYIVKVAAFLAVLVSISAILYILRLSPAGNVLHETIKHLENNTDKDKYFTLEDGSEVILASGSKLSFPEQFNISQREVYLTGEAFFRVTKKPQLPFLVNVGDITTKVLGTSFRVKATRDGSEVEVSVQTGKVSVYQSTRSGPESIEPNSTDSIILTPNHQVKFTQENRKFVTGLVEAPQVLPETINSPSPNAFNYYDTELSKILADLSKAYNIQLQLEKATLGDCPLTANLQGKDLYGQLGLICAAIQGSFDVRGTTILINGKDCE